jgi:Ca2+-dependent lipid-binding protein
MENIEVLAASGLGEPTDVVEIHISCEKLPDLDIFSKSDPVCHVYMKNSKHDVNWIKLGETEQINNNLNPEFVKSFELNYYFERDQMLKFELYDVDVMSKEHIGNLEIQVARVMGSHSQSFVGDLKIEGKTTSRGKIKVRLEQVSKNNDMIYFDAVAVNLPSKQMWFFGSDNPFMFIERSRSPDSDEFIRVIQTDHKAGTTNPKWNKLRFPAKKLCNGEIDNRLKFKLFSFSKSGKHKAYGEFVTTLAQLIQGELKYDL